MSGMKTGYCAVTADILHIGHIQFLTDCKSLCDHLTVGVMSDECVKKYKGYIPIISFDQRAAVISKLEMVDHVVKQDTFDFPKTYYHILFDSVEHQRQGATVYMSYTKGISSTIIKERIVEAARS